MSLRLPFLTRDDGSDQLLLKKLRFSDFAMLMKTASCYNIVSVLLLALFTDC
jgi:hypothetical protein